MKLLSNDELIKALTSIDFSDGIIGFTHLDERDAYKLLPLIQEQKIAHGEYVLGEDDPDISNPSTGSKDIMATWRNNFRKELRGRNV